MKHMTMVFRDGLHMYARNDVWNQQQHTYPATSACANDDVKQSALSYKSTHQVFKPELAVTLSISPTNS
jgi:hypothetical protein